jgi:hypothetical protein
MRKLQEQRETNSRAAGHEITLNCVEDESS